MKDSDKYLLATWLKSFEDRKIFKCWECGKHFPIAEETVIYQKDHGGNNSFCPNCAPQQRKYV